MKKSGFILLIFLLILVMTETSFSLNWNHGPYSYSVPNDLKVCDSGEKIVISYGTSIWLSINGGEDWTCLDEAILAVTNDQSMQTDIFFADDEGNYIIALVLGDQENYILVSENNGLSWIDRTPSNTPNIYMLTNFVADPFNDSKWYLSMYQYCLISENHGNSWDYIRCIENEFYNSGELFADKARHNIFYNTFNFIDNETELQEKHTFISRSTDGGLTWDENNPFIHFNQSLQAYHTSLFDFIPLSNGSSLSVVSVMDIETESFWQNHNLVLFDSTGTYLGRSGPDSCWVTAFLEDNSNPGHIYASSGRTNGLYVSNDFGFTWELLETSGLPYAKVAYIDQSKDSPDLILSTFYSGLYKSTDSGFTWTPVSYPPVNNLRRISFSESAIGYGNNGPFWFFHGDYSDQMDTISIAPEDLFVNSHNQLHCIKADTIIGSITSHANYPTEINRYLVQSLNGGESWDTLRDISQGDIASYYDESGLFLLASQPNGEITDYSYSIDYGNTYVDIPTPVDTNGVFYGTIVEFNNRYFYSFIDDIEYNKHLYQMDLNELTWEYILDSPDRWNFPHIMATSEGLIKTDNNDYYVWLYQNDEWTYQGTRPYEVGRIDSYVCSIGENPILFGIAEETGELIFSMDLGETWDVRIMELPNQQSFPFSSELYYDSFRSRLWLYTGLTGLFWIDFETLLYTEEHPIQLIPADPKLLTNYPNPFNASTRIQYHLEKPGNVKLDVYDITGRLVKSLMNGYQSAGIQNVFLDGSKLASGTYFLRLNAGNEIKNRRITLIK